MAHMNLDLFPKAGVDSSSNVQVPWFVRFGPHTLTIAYMINSTALLVVSQSP